MRCLLSLFICGAALVALGESASPPRHTIYNPSPRPVNNWSRLGGRVRNVPEKAGVFLIGNSQNSVRAEALENTVETMSGFTRIVVSLKAVSNAAIGNLSFKIAEQKAIAGVFVVDDPSLPPSLVAPEARWGIVNIAPLKSNADQAILEERTRKELWRVFAMVAGAADSRMDNCLLSPVFTPSDLDKIATRTISPDPLMVMQEHLQRMGFRQWREASYRRACQEGWAPMPTNAIQKAIWDKVHQLPDAPLVIKPETKKVVDK